MPLQTISNVLLSATTILACVPTASDRVDSRVRQWRVHFTAADFAVCVWGTSSAEPGAHPVACAQRCH